MSFEAPALAMIDSDSPEGAIAIDELRHDPLAKVAYSSNPSSAEAVELHPITSFEQSMFSRPEIAEALEAIHVTSLARNLETPSQSPVDPTLALNGLKWLRENLGGHAKNLRVAAIDTKSSLLADQRRQAEMQQIASELAQQEAARRSEAQTALTIQEAEKARQQDKQALYKKQLGQAFSQVNNVAPYLEIGAFAELSEELIIEEGPDGLMADGKRGFQPMLSKRVEGYLEEPRKLANDLGVAAELLGQTFDTAKSQPNKVIRAYTHTVLSAASEALSKSFYGIKDFSPEVVDKWIQLAEDLPADMTLEKLEQLCRDSHTGFIGHRLALVHGQTVLSNSLQTIAQTQPRKFIEKLYMTAEKGLDPKHVLKRHMTLGAIEECLDNEPLAGPLLSLASGTFTNRKLQQKAIDTQTSLERLGIPEVLLGFRDRSGNKDDKAIVLNDKNRRFIGNVYPSSIFCHSDINETPAAFHERANNLYQSYIKDFWEYAQTPEGKVNTIYGRFLSYQERQSGVISDPKKSSGATLRSLAKGLLPKHP